MATPALLTSYSPPSLAKNSVSEKVEDFLSESAGPQNRSRALKTKNCQIWDPRRSRSRPENS
ncbi:hypothetical protein PGTUg99_018719 [Puccinia graminis f. sp. tritici]|uniref:Uncharacterized protein n=1 Tax=Puccinia graminis f. sp. tritici TaxID=56615 RepID=A0A5B0SA83_PUCGR|nr:hypothetical protein PGTUg99_018719 [Puccinia graminis f. sp. tritici]